MSDHLSQWLTAVKERLEKGNSGIWYAEMTEEDAEFSTQVPADLATAVKIIERQATAINLAASSTQFKEGEYGYQFEILARNAQADVARILEGK